MASESERAKIMAEYMAHAAAEGSDNSEQEVDSNAGDSDSENDGEFGGSESEEEEVAESTIMKGEVSLSKGEFALFV